MYFSKTLKQAPESGASRVDDNQIELFSLDAFQQAREGNSNETESAVDYRSNAA